MPRARSASSIDSRIAHLVKRSIRGTVYSQSQFAQLGSRAAVNKALQRLAKSNVLRRLSRGLYDRPRQDADLGVLWPPLDAVIKALTEKDRIRVQPAGVYAANLLGLSEQVPSQVVLLTDGQSRSVRAGPLRIILKRTSPRSMATAGKLSGLLIQAFKILGPAHITPQRMLHLRKTIPLIERQKVLDDLGLAPAWMRPQLVELATNDTPSTEANFENKVRE